MALLHGSVIWRRGVDGIEGRLTPDPGQSAVPFKANRDCRHHIPKQRHRVTNWAAYDSALRQRGSLTVWFTEAAIAAWNAEPRATRGGQPRYSALAITTALTLRAVFRLALRQTEGLIASLLRLLGLDLAAPDHSTISRRGETLPVSRPRPGSEPVHLLVDSTGLKLCGSGEWLAPTMSAPPFPATSGRAASKSAMGNSTPYSQRVRSNRPRSDTGIKECRSTPKGVGRYPPRGTGDASRGASIDDRRRFPPSRA